MGMTIWRPVFFGLKMNHLFLKVDIGPFQQGNVAETLTARIQGKADHAFPFRVCQIHYLL